MYISNYELETRTKRINYLFINPLKSMANKTSLFQIFCDLNIFIFKIHFLRAQIYLVF